MPDQISPPEEPQMAVFRYYETHAKDVIARTHLPGQFALCEPFLKMLPPGAHILDAGCGAGYTSQHFLQQGCQVTAFDASLPLVQFAANLLGQPVFQLKFEELTYSDEFDGIWASASLLHLPGQVLPDVIHRLGLALHEHGVLYASFIYGPGETTRNGLLFNDFQEDRLEALLSAEPTLSLLRIWKTPDLPPARPDREWLHLLARRASTRSIPKFTPPASRNGFNA